MSLMDCSECGKTVEEQMEHWSEWHRHLLTWDMEADPRHVHSRLTFGLLDTFLHVVPLQYQVLFIEEDDFISCNHVALLTSKVPDVCVCAHCETRQQAVRDIQQWCANIKDVEEKKDDYSDFYFMASKLAKSLPVTCDENYFRRITLREVQNPYFHDVKDVPLTFLTQVNHKCVICTKGFKERGQLFVFPRCHHVFHTRCAEVWLGTKLTCPLCRESLVEQHLL